MKTNKDVFENFESAFTENTSGCRRVCQCGKEYWDAHNDGWTWDEGEIESLKKDPNAVALPHSVETVRFESRKYVADCTCWHARAEVIIEFVNGHAAQIARFLTLEKERKQKIAEESPVVG